MSDLISLENSIRQKAEDELRSEMLNASREFKKALKIKNGQNNSVKVRKGDVSITSSVGHLIGLIADSAINRMLEDFQNKAVEDFINKINEVK